MAFRIVLIIFGVVCLTVHIYGLRCYSCFGTGGENECENFKTYKDAMDGKRPEIKKNCTSPHNEACIIEIYSGLGKTVSHIRDCNNGHAFSFNASESNKKGAYNRLYQLIPNNETACVWDGNHMVCLTTCAEDFCNGPQLVEKTNGCDITGLSTALIIGVMSFRVIGGYFNYYN